MKNPEINARAVEAFYRIMDERNISQTAFAAKLGCAPSKLTEILKGRMSVQIEMIAKICGDYDISADWILLGRGKMSRRSDTIVQNVSGNHNATAVNGNATTGDGLALQEHIKFLERILEEKERTIQILLDR